MTLRGNHYEVLTLKPGATQEQIERAYALCRALYRDDALATYSVLEAEEIRAARARVEDAYGVLSDPVKRQEYDAAHGLAGNRREKPRREVIAVGRLGPVPRSLEAVPPPIPSPPPPPPPAAVKPVRPSEAAAPPAVVNGEELRRIRMERGVSLQQISTVIKVGVRTLEDIENDRTDRLPAPVYLRAFVQQYAQMIGLDGRATAEGYMSRTRKRA